MEQTQGNMELKLAKNFLYATQPDETRRTSPNGSGEDNLLDILLDNLLDNFLDS